MSWLRQAHHHQLPAYGQVVRRRASILHRELRRPVVPGGTLESPPSLTWLPIAATIAQLGIFVSVVTGIFL